MPQGNPDIFRPCHVITSAIRAAVGKRVGHLFKLTCRHGQSRIRPENTSQSAHEGSPWTCINPSEGGAFSKF